MLVSGLTHYHSFPNLCRPTRMPHFGPTKQTHRVEQKKCKWEIQVTYSRICVWWFPLTLTMLRHYSPSNRKPFFPFKATPEWRLYFLLPEILKWMWKSSYIKFDENKIYISFISSHIFLFKNVHQNTPYTIYLVKCHNPIIRHVFKHV